MKASVALALTTAPNFRIAKRIATTLLRERLVACANLLPAAKSLYWWKGEVQEDSEILLLLKTRQEMQSRLRRRLRQIHPYSVPEFLSFRADSADRSYLQWVLGETQARRKRRR